jgi:peptide-methionine (S)-S-oxide reductase
MGQGNDRGTQYRSGFYYFDDEQKALIEASKAAYEKALADAGRGRGSITTEVAGAADYEQYGGLWFYAEGYHQQYLAKPGARPYCSAQPQGVPLPPFESWCPKGLEHQAPKLPEAFWKQHGLGQGGCAVVMAPNEPIEWVDLSNL